MLFSFIRRDGVALFACVMAVFFVGIAGMGNPAWCEDTAAGESTAGESVAASADEPAAVAEPPEYATLNDVNTLWTCVAAFLVFFMQAGFAMVEAGFTRAKNVCNIVMKNLMDFVIGSLAYWMIGFGLMFGVTSGWLGWSDFLYDADASGDGSFGWAFLIFQTVFAATAATIVSGAMAERTKFVSYIAYSMAITVVVYPVFGGWAWSGLLARTGKGWLESLGFLDFAGSTVVHSVGGWAALAGAIVLGPRIGKFAKNGKPQAIPGHNIPLAALGVFILWFGWFGFNPGSTTAVGGGSFAKIAVTTNLAAAAGAAVAMIMAWVLFKKPDPSFTFNGALAGLVGITAGCNVMSPAMATLTGALAGAIVVFAVMLVDRIRVDDPVGAIAVHGFCGAWGTLAVGLFGTDIGLFTGGGTKQLGIQALGVGAAFAWAFFASLVVFLAIKYTMGLRVSESEELDGLDVVEHGIYGYPPILVADSLVGGATGGMARAAGSVGAMSGKPVSGTA